jgi:hypothetical protein
MDGTKKKEVQKERVESGAESDACVGDTNVEEQRSDRVLPPIDDYERRWLELAMCP